MTKKRHGKWTADPDVVVRGDEQPDYRSRMSARTKNQPPPIVYPEEVMDIPEDDSHLFLLKNILS